MTEAEQQRQVLTRAKQFLTHTEDRMYSVNQITFRRHLLAYDVFVGNGDSLDSKITWAEQPSSQDAFRWVVAGEYNDFGEIEAEFHPTERDQGTDDNKALTKEQVQLRMKVLRAIPVLSKLSPRELERIAKRLEVDRREAGSKRPYVVEGKEAKQFFILREGSVSGRNEDGRGRGGRGGRGGGDGVRYPTACVPLHSHPQVRVTKKRHEKTISGDDEIEVAVLKAPTFFGERSLFEGETYSATVYSRGSLHGDEKVRSWASHALGPRLTLPRTSIPACAFHPPSPLPLPLPPPLHPHTSRRTPFLLSPVHVLRAGGERVPRLARCSLALVAQREDRKDEALQRTKPGKATRAADQRQPVAWRLPGGDQRSAHCRGRATGGGERTIKRVG